MNEPKNIYRTKNGALYVDYQDALNESIEDVVNYLKALLETGSPYEKQSAIREKMSEPDLAFRGQHVTQYVIDLS